MIKRGIDISEHQGNIDEKLIKESDFCMIRTGYGSENKSKQTDKYYIENVAKCLANNVPYGFYHFSYAKNLNMALNEADFFLELVDKVSNTNHRPLYPLAYDVEAEQLNNMSKEELTEAIVQVGDKIEKAGYYFVIYAYRSYFLNKLELSKLERFDKWVADWTNISDEKLQAKIKHGIRQYTVDRNLNLDRDYAYKDYPTIITNMYHKGTQTEENEKIKVGDKVKVLKAVQYDNGKPFKTYYNVYDVLEIYPKGSDRIVIGIGDIVTAAVKAENLEVI